MIDILPTETVQTEEFTITYIVDQDLFILFERKTGNVTRISKHFLLLLIKAFRLND